MRTFETATEIRPFHIDEPADRLEDLRRRIAATRLPSKEFVEDRSQGVQLATIRSSGPETVHAVRNAGTRIAAELATYFVEKDKPFLVVVE